MRGHRVLVTAALVWLLSAATMVAGQAGRAGGAAQPAAGARPLMSDEVFKNIQVLKGIPADQFMGTMGFFSASTGLSCGDCHTEESGGDWAKYADDNALKRQTRRMVTMMNAINQANFGGRQVVTCFTCHRGFSRPHVMPSLDLLYSSPPPEEPGDPIVQANGQPSADSILDKYLQAVGGPQRLAALTSLTAKGAFVGFGDADRAPVDFYANAQGQTALVVHTLSGDSTTTFDGREGWVAAPATNKPVALLQLTGEELDGARLEAQVFFPGRIKQALTMWRVGYPTEIDNREVNVVQGTMPGGGTATLCFDRETGLLTRLVRWGPSPVGRIVTRVDYSDYRDVAGVKIPHKWTLTWLDGRSRYELTAAQPNVAIPAARFAKPAASTPP